MGGVIDFLANGLTAAITAITTVFILILLDLIRDQAKASTPLIAEWLRRIAVKRLPEPLRERANEEWASWLDETPGPIAKLVRAFGFLISAPGLRVEKEEPDQADKPVTTWARGTIPQSTYEYANWLIWLQAASSKKSIWLETEVEEWLTRHHPNHNVNDPETTRLYLKVLKAYRNSIAHAPHIRRKQEDDPGDVQ
jgi:hypothetical protein